MHTSCGLPYLAGTEAGKFSRLIPWPGASASGVAIMLGGVGVLAIAIGLSATGALALAFVPSAAGVLAVAIVMRAASGLAVTITMSAAGGLAVAGVGTHVQDAVVLSLVQFAAMASSIVMCQRGARGLIQPLGLEEFARPHWFRQVGCQCGLLTPQGLKTDMFAPLAPQVAMLSRVL